MHVHGIHKLGIVLMYEMTGSGEQKQLLEYHISTHVRQANGSVLLYEPPPSPC